MRSRIRRVLCVAFLAAIAATTNVPSFGQAFYGSVVGAYEVLCASGTSRIVFDMYEEEHAETRAPAGFTIAN